MHKIVALTLAGMLVTAAATINAQADIDVRPDGLTHYSNCVNQAKDTNFVSVLDRHVLYRCHGETATSYFNYLGTKRVKDHVVDEPTGTFVYRTIEGVGRCWNKIADELGAPISYYGCDIYVEI
ncbi:MAG TPA: hypothetical protein VEH76_01745 [Methylocystis sp.]|nr:hypothetical protein [Methylocystis sp.]